MARGLRNDQQTRNGLTSTSRAGTECADAQLKHTRNVLERLAWTPAESVPGTTPPHSTAPAATHSTRTLYSLGIATA